MFRIFQIRYEYYYGGILTFDIIGCNSNCVFCFNDTDGLELNEKTSNLMDYFLPISYKFSEEIEKHVNWKFRLDKIIEISPKNLAIEIINFTKKMNYNKIRFSSGEPTLYLDDLLEFFKIFHENCSNIIFILETNGINLGRNPLLFMAFQKYLNWLYIRLSLKIWDKKRYSIICSNEENYNSSRKAAEILIDKFDHQKFHFVFISDLLTQKCILDINKWRKNFSIEYEPLYFYPHVCERIKNRGLNEMFF